MNSFYYDILLTLGTFLLIGFLSYKAMRSNRRNGDGDDEGGLMLETEPKIDLPPGVVWPSEAPKRRIEDDLLV